MASNTNYAKKVLQFTGYGGSGVLGYDLVSGSQVLVDTIGADHFGLTIIGLYLFVAMSFGVYFEYDDYKN